MNRQRLRALALLSLGGALCLSVGLRSTLTTVDLNHDGRVDVWEYQDGPFGTLTKIVEDTNFDGRPDRYSYMVDGALRRESDTNFDGRVDEVEQFDVDGTPTRTVRDSDFDGIADLLVLYRDGFPIYLPRASADQLAATLPSQHGSSFTDPFENETTVRRVSRNVDPLSGLASSSKPYTLPLSRASPAFCTALRVSSVLTLSSQFDPRQLFPRGPPPPIPHCSKVVHTQQVGRPQLSRRDVGHLGSDRPKEAHDEMETAA